MTDEKKTPQLTKMAVRAPALDDEKNKLAAFVATGKSGMVENLIYVHEKQFYELEAPGYITITIQTEGRVHDF